MAETIEVAREAAGGSSERPPARSRRWLSSLWAVLFLLAIGGWLASGEIVGAEKFWGKSDGEADGGVVVAGSPQVAGPALEADGRAPAEAPEVPIRVRVAEVVAEQRTAELILRGRTEVEARVQVRAETGGVVRSLEVAKGDAVAAGALLCRLDEGSRRADLLEAKAAVAEAEAANEASERLRKRGFTPEIKSMGDRRQLDAARANLERIELDIARTRITAPIAGVVEALDAREGDLLSVGSPCVTLVRMDPLLVVAGVSERDVSRLAIGQSIEARLVTGERVSGRLRFIAPSADVRTRTFRVEAELANPANKLRDGVTADLVFPLESRPAHRIRPSILSLADDGTIGVKIVDDSDRVRFLPVVILADGRDEFWVSGLPARARVITVGQEYVLDGQLVEPVDTAEAESDAGRRGEGSQLSDTQVSTRRLAAVAPGLPERKRRPTQEAVAGR